ncbi:hypothetical protein [uncultured Thomasclavelia sp.]|uniref:hypothetical protein n=1 Tax=uncultured Thomasclavelia sp. TaxID=3025759 RepID=UPI0025F66F7C|nr:hypothetical protein [uncultured Thomasclavelia sp.]
MKEKIIIGQKITVIGIVGGYILWIFFSLILAVGFYNLVGKYFFGDVNINLFISIIIFIISEILVTPLLGMGDYLEFSDTTVNYYRVSGYFQKWHRALMIIFKHQDVYSFKMKTNDIFSLQLSYVRVYMVYNQVGYQLKMTFLLNDGSIISVMPSGIDDMEKGKYEQAFKILENNGTSIVDKYRLRKVLNDKNSFYLHIKELEERKDD